MYFLAEQVILVIEITYSIRYIMPEAFAQHLPDPQQEARLSGLTISQKLATVFIALLLLAAANILVVRKLLGELNGTAEIMNVAGKMRMLSQKIAFETTKVLLGQDIDKNKVTEAQDDFEAALLALERGGLMFGVSVKPLSSRHHGLLSAARTDWIAYRSHVVAALVTTPSQAGLMAALDVVTADAARQLANAENLVHDLSLEARQAQDRALTGLYALLLLDALVLGAVFLAVRRQIVHPLRELVQRSRELAEGNYQSRASHHSADEIGQLATSFNYSAQRIGSLIADIELDRQNLKQAESMFRGFAENSVVGVYIVQDQRFRFVNSKMAEMFAYEQGEMIASVGVFDLVAESDRAQVEENMQKRLRGELLEVNYERRARRKDGSMFDVEVFGSTMQLDGAAATIGIMLDISERKQLDLSLRALSACNRALVRATDESVLLTEICRIVREVCGYPFVWVGYAEHDASKKVRPAALAEAEPGALMSMINHVSWGDAETARGPTGSAIRKGQVIVLKDLQTNALIAPWREFMVRHAIVSAMALPLKAGNKILGALTVYAQQADTFGPDEVRVAQELADNLAYGINALRAEASRRQYARELEHQAHHDGLTGLPNRLMLQDRLCQAIAFAARYTRPVWVVFLDLDHFKFVNDSLGHKAGDTLLNTIAARLQFAMRESDTVARLGGDEFVLVLPERKDEHLAASIVQRIKDTVAQPLTIEGQEFILGCSIGVAVYPNDGADPETLIKHADIAMYRAKETGRNNFQFFTPSMNERLIERIRIEGDLRNAIEREEFVLHYQPQVDTRSGRIIGMEALIRWQHPALGMVAPLRFIGLAEETGLIIPIGAWVLRCACAQNKAWQQAGLGHLRIAVNLSARQFAQPDLVQSIAAVLEETGLAPQYLEIELTESLVMTDVEHAIGILHDLKTLGVRLSLDDFGTGYSSLSYLKRLPIDALKIDQSFVRDITHATNDAAIVVSIISLAHNLQLDVIAEGVETPAQLAYLKQHGCNEMQGYYFSKPVPADAFGQILKQDGLLPLASV
jgi:diguanylate cyclase (GGDEF)-like protein/PAS domain S-box-containing protein